MSSFEVGEASRKEHAEEGVEQKGESAESGGLFEVSREKLVQEAEKNLEGMAVAFESVSKTNDALAKDVENIPGKEGEALRQRIRALQERAEGALSRFGEATAMYTRLVVLGGMAVLGPNPEDVAGHSGGERSLGVSESTERGSETFGQMVARAKKELSEDGITSEQRKTYQPLNEVIYEGVNPFFYEESEGKLRGDSVIPVQKIKEAVPNLWYGRENRYDMSPSREDAWRLYLGIPQQADTFGVSDYRPGRGSEENIIIRSTAFGKSWASGAITAAIPGKWSSSS
jgi:hypothetical protein